MPSGLSSRIIDTIQCRRAFIPDDMPSNPRSPVRRFIEWQMRLSQKIDTMLPELFRVDGATHFRTHILPYYLATGTTVYDIGGGSRPCIDIDTKRHLTINLVGVDIDETELAGSPAGVYDQTIVADICQYEAGAGDADLVVSRSTLEHVKDTDMAFAAFSRILRPGGRLLLFAPSRNAVFARLNLILPERLKRTILFSLFPHKAQGHDGFPAFYNRCTPRHFRNMAERHGFAIETLQPYFMSSYFSFFAPLYLIWRAWIVLFHFFCSEQAAETFSMVCVKKLNSR